jgi:hypothetical protein
MKKLSKTMKLISVLLLCLTCFSSMGGNYFVSLKGNNQDGRSWNSAWNEFNQINWKTIEPGSTIYIAAGTFKTSIPVVTVSGITIKRATKQEHGSSKGWEKSLDGEVIVDHAPTAFLEINNVENFTFDGGNHSPWKFREIGITGRGGQICLRNSKNVIIRNVELNGNSEASVDGGPEDGLRVNYCDNLTVEHCYIHDFRQHSIPKAAHEDAVQMPSGNHVIFRYNIFANCGMLLFLGDPVWNDQWVNDITVEHNLFYCDSGIGRGTYNGIDLKGTNRYGTDTTRIENNTFVLRSNESSRLCLYFSTAGKSNPALTYFRNNLIYNSTIGDVKQVPFHSNNCYYNPLIPGNTISEEGMVTADPLFLDYERQNFHLQPGSPCIDKGLENGYFFDFDNKKISNKPDIGCFEFTKKKK